MNPILVINDDASLLSEMVKVLKDGGYAHLAASSGEQALTLADGYDFSLVILDLKQGDMDGDVIYEKLLKKEEHYVLPVVALIDGLDGEEVEVLNKLTPQGAVTLLSKPPKKEWLEDLFKKHTNKV